MKRRLKLKVQIYTLARAEYKKGFQQVHCSRNIENKRRGHWPSPTRKHFECKLDFYCPLSFVVVYRALWNCRLNKSFDIHYIHDKLFGGEIESRTWTQFNTLVRSTAAMWRFMSGLKFSSCSHFFVRDTFHSRAPSTEPRDYRFYVNYAFHSLLTCFEASSFLNRRWPSENFSFNILFFPFTILSREREGK